MLRRLNTNQLDVFCCGGDDRPVLYRDAEFELDEQKVRHLIANGVELFVRLDDFQEACADLAASLGDIAVDDSVSAGDRFQVMQLAIGAELQRTLTAVEPDSYVGLASEVSSQFNKLISLGELLPSELFAIARHDSQTFTHVTNVAGYATMLAQELGITDSEDLDEIAMGAMLHDMGKRSIPNTILGKAGRLTTEERFAIEQHPVLGYKELRGRNDVTHAQRMMVYQHHEHLNGNGYPVRVCGDEIHPWARLLTVVDVFDALTGSRPYRKPCTKEEATDFIVDRAGTQFDKEMAECWTSTINQF